MSRERMNYDINLASRPFVNISLPSIIAMALVVALIGITVFNILVVLSAGADIQDTEVQIQALQEKIDEHVSRINNIDKRLATTDYVQARDSITYINDLIEKRKLSWTLLFDRLEELTPSGMRMLRISPTVSGGKVGINLRLEVEREEVIRDFISALDASNYFSDVVLRSQSVSENTGELWDLSVTYIDEK